MTPSNPLKYGNELLILLVGCTWIVTFCEATSVIFTKFEAFHCYVVTINCVSCLTVFTRRLKAYLQWAKATSLPDEFHGNLICCSHQATTTTKKYNFTFEFAHAQCKRAFNLLLFTFTFTLLYQCCYIYIVTIIVLLHFAGKVQMRLVYVILLFNYLFGLISRNSFLP